MLNSQLSIDTLALFSRREIDQLLVERIGKALGARVVLLNGVHDFGGLLPHDGATLFFFDLDLATHSSELGTTTEELLREYFLRIPPSHLVAISNDTVSNYGMLHALLHNVRFYFHHNIIRSQGNLTSDALIQMFMASYSRFSGSIESFFIDSKPKISKIKIAKTTQRGQVTQAVSDLLEEMNFPPRLASRVSQSSDELLMNAIFDAPRASSGRSLRRHMDRKADLLLNLGEKIEFEMGWDSKMILIRVSDSYGSMEIDVALKYIYQDYRRKNYQAGSPGPSAGLGLYGIVDSGFSFCAFVAPGQTTETILIVPRLRSAKDLKSSFRFFGFAYQPLQALED